MGLKMGHSSTPSLDTAGTWHDWFIKSKTGTQSIVDQAKRQIKAAQGVPIEWHFEEKIVRDLVEHLINKEKLKGIKFIYTPLTK